jgi:photosystem II stability/assembly factor-like uncharacterized protein
VLKVRVVGAIGVVVALVGCGSVATRQAGGPESDAAPSSIAAASSVAASSAPGSPAVAANSAASAVNSPGPSAASSGSPFPAGSELALSSADMGSDARVLYARNGVVLVAVTLTCCGSEETKPSTLWLSTDMTHWRDVTPPGSREQVNPAYFPGLYAGFDEASFLDPSTGWVTTWNGGNLAVTAYRTTDGGKTWSAVGIGGHSDHGDDADWIQLLTPKVAFSDGVTPTAPHVTLSVTTDSGQSWRTVYDWPTPTTESDASVPLDMPMVFVSETRGFAASGIPPGEPFEVSGDFLTTNDGGVHWARLIPPSIKSASCPTVQTDPVTVQCLVSLPRFAAPAHGALATEVIRGAKATVGFDTTSDGGTSWQAAASVDVPLPVFPSGGYPMTNYAFVGTPSMTTWWIASYSADGVTSRVTSDAGSHWSEVTSRGFDGTPNAFDAVDATHALLTTFVIGADGSTDLVYSTADAGRTWQRLFPS